MEQRGATSLTEVLRTVPRVSLGAGEGGIAAGDRTFIAACAGFSDRERVEVISARMPMAATAAG